MKKFGIILALFLMLGIIVPYQGFCQNGTNVLIQDGTLTAYFSPDAIGTYYLDYSADWSDSWQLTVTVYWQSDSYIGWHEFYNVTYNNHQYANDIVELNSGTDDNVRYKVEYRTNSYSTYMTWAWRYD